MHPDLYMFASASTDNIKQWKCPKGEFIQNLSGHNAIINALAVNQVLCTQHTEYSAVIIFSPSQNLGIVMHVRLPL